MIRGNDPACGQQADVVGARLAPGVPTDPIPRVSVVIPTRDRPDSLRRCLDTVLTQLNEVAGGAEVLVVDDGGGTAATGVPDDNRIRVIPGFGEGPARARNRGIDAARGEIVAFTDDDVRVHPGWLNALVTSLDARPEAVGVRGSVIAPPFDVLYEHRVEDPEGGSYLTCNVAYRRQALEECGGFYPGFPFAAHEDRDLGWRMELLGPVLFERSMVVEHPPRKFTVREWVLRGRMVKADWVMFLRHPESRPSRFPTRWAPLLLIVRRWVKFAIDPQVVERSPARAFRLGILAIGQSTVAMAVTLTDWQRVRDAQAGTGPIMERSVRLDTIVEVRASGRPNAAHSALRIAYLGPTPDSEKGGVIGTAWSVVQALSDAGHQVDCYLAEGGEGDPPQSLRNLPGVRVVWASSKWRYGRWYSNHPLTKFVTGQLNLARLRNRLVQLMAEQHEVAPYDVQYQYSTIESFGRRVRRSQLPPLVMHPSAHAAGELSWMCRERAISRRCEGRVRPFVIRTWLRIRSNHQRHDMGKADGVFALSRAFGRQLIADYGVDAKRLVVVPYPIDLDVQRPVERDDGWRLHPVRIGVVGRLSTRKGLEQTTELSHRLQDMAGHIAIEVVGGPSPWSNHHGPLADLNPETSRYLGTLSRDDLATWMATQDLLVQLAEYEPFGLIVAEALASGVPVVVTTEVGASEDVAATCCTRVEIEDVDELEKAVREMITRVRSSDAGSIRKTARQEAERLWAPKRIGALVEDGLIQVVKRSLTALQSSL